MDAVTYPDGRVAECIRNLYIPLKVSHKAEPLATDFNVKWTPVLITLGADNREHHRTVGFLDPDNFIANARLGIGKYHFDNDRYEEALLFFSDIISQHPQSDVVPEVIFLQGVTLYKSTGHRKHLKNVYESLDSRFPDNEWTKRAYPYRLL